MNNKRCVLEYMAKEAEVGIERKKIESGKRPIQEECLSCTKETRCDYYIPLIRMQNIAPKERLYRRKYNK